MDKEFYTEAAKSVVKMNELFGKPSASKGDTDLAEAFSTAFNLVDEEVLETIAAYEGFSPMAAADGWCDVLVVALGFFYTGVEDVEVIWGERVGESLQNIGSVCEEHNLSPLKLMLEGHLELNTNPSEGLSMILAACVYAAEKYPELNIKANFKAVMENNLTKCCIMEETAAATVDKYQAEGVSCYKEYVTSHNRWVVKRDDGKVLKPVDYQPVTLSLAN